MDDIPVEQQHAAKSVYRYREHVQAQHELESKAKRERDGEKKNHVPESLSDGRFLDTPRPESSVHHCVEDVEIVRVEGPFPARDDLYPSERAAVYHAFLSVAMQLQQTRY